MTELSEERGAWLAPMYRARVSGHPVNGPELTSVALTQSCTDPSTAHASTGQRTAREGASNNLR